MSEGWEGGERQGIRWRRVGVAALAVAVGAAWWFGRDGGLSVQTDGPSVGGPTELADVVVTGPLQAGDRWYCPKAFPIRAYDEAGRYYPSHYPRPGGEIPRPDACFADEARAADAGYEIAPPPSGSVVAGDVYVVPSAAPGREACAVLARQSGVAVPCPTRLPSPATGPTCLDGRCRYGGGVIIEQRSFDIPAGFCDECDPHVVLTAIEGEQPDELVVCPSLPGEGEDAGSVTAMPPDPGLSELGPTPEVRECGEGPPWIPGIGGVPHEGHTVARWRNDGVTFAVSVEGYGEAQTELLHAILGSVEICERQGGFNAVTRCQDAIG